MIDYGIYEIQKNSETGEFHITEQLDNRSFAFDSIDEMIEWIRKDLEDLESK